MKVTIEYDTRSSVTIKRGRRKACRYTRLTGASTARLDAFIKAHNGKFIRNKRQEAVGIPWMSQNPTYTMNV